MLKDALKTFAGKHNNYRARQLKKILETEPPFFVTGSLPDEEKQEEAHPSLLQGPALYPVMDTVIAQFLDAKSIACLSVCSSSLYAQTKGPLWWKEKLIALGCHRESLDKVIHGKAVENYKRLYGVMLKIPYNRRINSTAWELCCLSGEPLSIKWAEQHEALNSNTRAYNGTNALHNAAWSGSVEAIRYCIGTFRIPAASADNNGANALHYAAWSGSVEAIRYCIETLRIPAASPDYNGANVLHYAAFNGSVEAIRYCIETLRIPVASTENNGANALHNAALSGSVEAIRYCIETLRIPAASTKNNGANALHHAAWSGSVEAVYFVRRLAHTLNLPLHAIVQDHSGHDAFWYADKSKNSDAIKTALNIPIEQLMQIQEKSEVPDSHGVDPSERRQIGSR